MSDIGRCVVPIQVVPLQRVPLQDVASNREETDGNAVHLGNGVFLSAAHLFEVSGHATVRLPDRQEAIADPAPLHEAHRQELKRRDMALLRLEDLPHSGLYPTVIASFDRWKPLKAAGWFHTDENSYQFREFRGEVVSAHARPDTLDVALYELRLDPPENVSLAGLSGGGIFSEDGELVGIVSHERADAPGRSLFFSSLEDLWREGVPLSGFLLQERLPSAWSRPESSVQSLTRHERFLEREPILQAIEQAVSGDYVPSSGGKAKNGYVLLLGGPKRGKSAIMAELVRRRGWAHCAWLFAVRQQITLRDAEEALVRQIGYLLGRTRMETTQSMGLAEMLRAWSGSGREPLVLFIDALDELPGTDGLEILPQSLPEGVFVVVSLRHEPLRHVGVSALQPCLGVINLDSGPDDLGSAVRLVDEEIVRDDSRQVIDKLWIDWERLDRYVKLPDEKLPADLRAAIDAKGRDIVGYHAAYARELTKYLNEEQALPAPNRVPEPEDLDKAIWEHLFKGLDRESSETQKAYRDAFGLIATARSSLHTAVFQKLTAFDTPDKLDRFLAQSFSAIRKIDDLVMAHHITWNDLVREKLTGAQLAQCHRLLANGSEEWPQPDVDRTYWLRHSPGHLMEIITGGNIPPVIREAARRDWAACMSRPDFLADRGALDGVASLLEDLAAGIDRGAEMPEGDWKLAFTIFLRDSTFLHTILYSEL